MNDQTRTLIDIIHARRSYPLPDVSPEPIDLADVREMLDAANWSPSHGMTEPWRFCVFSGAGRLALGRCFAEAYRAVVPLERQTQAAEQAQMDRAQTAPVWISLGLLRTADSRMPEWEDMSSVAIAAQHIHLVASGLGYACKWTSGDIVRHACVLDLVGLQAPSKLLGFLYLGRPASPTPPPGRRGAIDGKVSWRG